MFETKKKLREEIALLNAEIAGKERALINAQKDVLYYRGKMYEYTCVIDELNGRIDKLNDTIAMGEVNTFNWRQRCRKTEKELERINKCLDVANGRGDDYRDEYEKCKKEINMLNKCRDADIVLIEKLRKENEALKQQLETTNADVDSFYPSNAWSVVAELMISRQANDTLKEKVARLQKKLDEIGEIVEE